jgi:hypothetical protein
MVPAEQCFAQPCGGDHSLAFTKLFENLDLSVKLSFASRLRMATFPAICSFVMPK